MQDRISNICILVRSCRPERAGSIGRTERRDLGRRFESTLVARCGFVCAINVRVHVRADVAAPRHKPHHWNVIVVQLEI